MRCLLCGEEYDENRFFLGKSEMASHIMWHRGSSSAFDESIAEYIVKLQKALIHITDRR